MQLISKSQLKSQLLEYLRQVEKSKQPLIITHEKKPVLKITPYQEDADDILKSLQHSVILYRKPTEPINEKDWEALI